MPANEPSRTDRAPKELGARERIVAAAGASVVSAFVVNPLDVVKTRMQAQAAAGASAAGASATTIPHNVLLEKFAFTVCPESCPNWASNEAASAAASTTLRPKGQLPVWSQGTYASMRHIVKTEGWSQLWRGTDMALLMAVPMVGIYMPLYDYTKSAIQPQLGTSLAPLCAGALSRTAAVLCTAPLDLLRTRMQAMLKQTHLQPAVAGASATSRTSQWLEIIRHVQASSGTPTARVGALWTGVGATLARDVPFSALYWALLEPVRLYLLPHHQQQSQEQQQQQQHRLPAQSYAAQSISSSGDNEDVQLHASAQPTQSTPAQGQSDAPIGFSSNSARLSGMPDSSSRAESASREADAAADDASSSRQGHSMPGSAQWSADRLSKRHEDGVRWQQHSTMQQQQQHAHAEGASGLADMRAAGLKDRGSSNEAGTGPEEAVMPRLQLLLANLVAGAVGGSAAAALTQPLDVVKTRAQLGHHGRSTSVLQALRELAREGGVRALFTGVTPRALKAAPACAIVLASYETLKAVYASS